MNLLRRHVRSVDDQAVVRADFLSRAERILLSPATIILFFGAMGIFVNVGLYSEWGMAHSIYALGIFIFCLFHVVTTELVGKPTFPTMIRQGSSDLSGMRFVRRFYWIVAVLGFALSVNYMSSVGIGLGGSFFFNLRYAHTIDGSAPKILQYLGLFSTALAFYYAYKRRYKLAVTAIVISIVVSLAFAERTSILMQLAGMAYLVSWTNGFKVRHLLLFFGVFLVLSLIIAASANKMGGDGRDHFVLQYIGYGLTAFEVWIEGSYPVDCPSLVFGSLVQIFEDGFRAGECARVPGAPRGQFNVYTYIKEPYMVYGPVGVAVIMAALGVFYSLLFRIAIVKRGLFLVFLSVLIYPLVMVFYAWQFNLTTFIYLAVLLVALFVRIRVVTGYPSVGHRADMRE